MANQNQWLLERQLETAQILSGHEERIKTLEAERMKRSFFLPNLWQAVSALAAIAAILVAIFKP